MKTFAGSLPVLILAGALSAACSSAPVKSRGPAPVVSRPTSSAPLSVTLPASSLTEDQRIIHMLNRLGYGPRPGDLERVKRIGLAAYVEDPRDSARIPGERGGAGGRAFQA